MPTLIVGLGNPGKEYEATRHNVGFMVLEALRKEWGETWRKERDVEFLKRGDVFAIRPLSFMNNSGPVVARFVNFYKIPLDRVWVVHDDVDLTLGTLRVSFGSSSAGHKGVESIIESLGSKDFWRFRIGVGRPQDSRMEIENYVLQPFSREEQNPVSDAVGKCIKALQEALESGPKSGA